MSCQTKKPECIAAVLAVSLGLICPAQAQSLGELIDQAKSARLSQMDRSGLPSASAARPRATSALIPAVPLLWSLSGIHEQFQAVLIYKSRAYTVHSDEAGSWRVGPWTVAQIDDSGIRLTASGGQRETWLPGLSAGASAYPHFRHLVPLGQAPMPPSSPLSGAAEAHPPSAARVLASQLPAAAMLANPPVEPNPIAPSAREANR